VSVSSWFSSSKPFVYYQTTFGRAFVFGRSDWEYVLNTFAFGEFMTAGAWWYDTSAYGQQ
jgi:hypothetical protein